MPNLSLAKAVDVREEQERLLRMPNLSLAKAVDVCRAAEISKLQARTLNNESATDSIVTKHNRKIRDRVVISIKNREEQERLLRMPNLSLAKAVDVCRAAEISKLQARTLNNESATDSIVTKHNRKTNKFKYADKKNRKIQQETRGSKCRKCNISHEPKKCPAYGKKTVGNARSRTTLQYTVDFAKGSQREMLPRKPQLRTGILTTCSRNY
ncbi:hypothetical protein QE152_g9064 [Popillia japonica]|uniref:Uncharacterized protein n=1 Tax=Popillia japonica TaxID=7064 RepID=A0AAW1M094_POPJA